MMAYIKVSIRLRITLVIVILSVLSYGASYKSILNSKPILSLEPYRPFVVKDNYDFNNATLDLPEGCVLIFEGGRISNCTINGHYNDIKAPRYKIFDNVRFTGHFSVRDVYPEWWGGFPNRKTDCYEAIQSALDFASAHGGDEGKNVKLAVGRYGISHTLLLRQGCRIEGVSPRSTWIYSLNGTIEGEWIIDTPFGNNMQPVSSARVENIQIRCTDSMRGEHFSKTCNGIRCRGWNETCGIQNVHINGFDIYGLYLTQNERTITQNCCFSDIFISNSNRKDGKSVGLFLDDVRQCIFESITIDNGPSTIYGIGYGIYSIGHCDLNLFLKINIEDCCHPIYVRDGIDECSFNGLMINNPTHKMMFYEGSKKYRAVIRLEKSERGFTLNGYKRINNSGVEYDIVNDLRNQYIVFNSNVSTGNSNYRWYVYAPKDK